MVVDVQNEVFYRDHKTFEYFTGDFTGDFDHETLYRLCGDFTGDFDHKTL